eukprot:NODE_3418_length_1356_cov_7.917275_g2980_i0.p1 GENE.NODE_3418_length_1356_cov_7.917275_g2980_i0~~NODE_3418_length_1356_cov_7.917275_g2980_i0.p1  ORF type:complete len:268 (+),score=49.05 NODE_3418_length_1356_cov_7.917275_g2980_i0:66-869(+)
MAFRALGWIQTRLGVDITGEAEFEANHRKMLEKKQDQTESIIDENDKPKMPDREIRDVHKVAERLVEEATQGSKKKKSLGSADKLISITPTKLYFPTPLDKFIMNTLSTQNLTENYIAYKIKATAPARYAVKPRQGVLASKEHVDIHITLRPTKDDPAELRDKFLIEARVMASDEVDFYNRTSDIQTLWRAKREGTVGIKIRCRFTSQLPPNFIVKSVVEPSIDDDDVGDIAIADDDDEEGEILPDTIPSSHQTHHRHVRRMNTENF